MSESQPLLKKNVVKFEDGDERNPRNWPQWRKLMAWLPIIPVDLAVSFGASGYSPATEDLAADFGVSTEVAILGLSLYTLALAFGPMINAPMSEYFGRLPVYVGLYAVSLPFFVGAALAPTIQVFLVCRFFSGLFQSVTIANLGGTIADLYEVKQTGKPMSIFIWAATGGSSLGFALMSIVARPWRDVIWALLGISGGLWLIMCSLILFAGETRHSVLIRGMAEERRKAGEDIDVPKEYRKMTARQLVVSVQSRPFHLLTTETIVMCAATYNGYLFGISFLLNGALSIVYGSDGLNTSQIGLCFLGVFAGISIGPLTNLIQEGLYKGDPETRLHMAKVAAVALPISLFWFAWTTHIVPAAIASTVLWGWSFFTLILMSYTYTEDAYGEYSGSALAGLGFVRNFAGAGFPLFGRQMYHGLGDHWASTVLAFLALLMVPIPFFLSRYGKTLRKQSAFAKAHESEDE